ncbi:MAG: hypothetical protein HYS17_10535 [Micavibrio aeruginosavorus]|uniref:N-acetyltransferase domain-containing protein n=1 Tax=Micavibrio aeruginosavorus TaxID=349221 RepID=A0A7T5R1P7_9BACT|nr:MAG: hypothetical protein HYS17_10535 [Micavibrio aeruginosavorus]
MSTPLPGALRLAFSTAAHQPAIKRLFDPAIKNSIDPDGQVAGREGETFSRHVVQGHAAVLEDGQGNTHTLTMAWHLAASGDTQPRPRHIEIGTALTCLPGFHSASVVTSALALAEWWRPTLPRGLIAAEVGNDNIPSVKLFRNTLGWRPLKDPKAIREINGLSYANVVDYSHTDDSKTWYVCARAARVKAAATLLAFMDRGNLIHKDGRSIPLDLSALASIGLTRPHLEALARGITTKKDLRSLPLA